MTALEAIYAELKELPPPKLEKVAAVVHTLIEEWEAERKSSFDDLAGCMSGNDVDSMEKAIAQNCGRVDENEW